MRSLLTILCVAIVLVAGAASADDARLLTVDQPDRIPSFLGYAQDKFIVVMNPAVTKLQAQKASSGVIHIGNADFDALSDRFAVSNLRQQFVGSETRAPRLASYYKIKFENGTLEDAMAAFEANPLVDHVEPIGIHTMYATPNDTYFSPYQWYHNAAGDHDIDSPEAWDIQTGSSSTVIALLDSGTRYYHPDLGGANASPSNPGAARGNMWINNAELNGSSGVDDDGNGYVDDWIGYDFIDGVSNCWPGEDCNTKDNDPRDFNGHGTHTAGIMGMLTNDGYGMAGVAGGWGNGSQAVTGNGCKIMTLRMGYSYNYLGQEYGVVMMDAAAEAFYYAADNGAKIASCSWGSSNSGGIGAAATYFINNGGIIFVAAGNDGSQTADYLNGRGDCVSVAATDENDNAASFTTYGTWVDISAPGNNIYATYHDHTDPNTNYWASLSGTSMATPMTAATAGLIWSQNPTWTSAQITSQLYSSADNIDAFLSSQYLGKMGAGRINAYNAVNTGPPPAPVANFVGSPTTGTEPLTVNFTDQSTGSISTWAWTFGDGGTSSAQNPSHTYAAGTYSVTLTVTGPGGSDALTRTNYITVNPCTSPTASFVGSPTSGDYPLTVNFTNGSSGATSYSWTFGDGGTSTATNPSHTYTSAGTFTVTLTATNSCGSDQMVRTNYITVTTPPCDPPVADFSGSPTSGTYPLTVNFTDLSTNSPTSWSWAFGDGGTSTAQNPSHTYTAAGTYAVELTATNACGFDNVVKTNYITVTAPTVEAALAEADISVLGTYTSSFLETHTSDNVYEAITEALSTSHPKKTTSQAEHKWTFTVNATGAATFYLEAYRSNNADGDNFIFAYSTDDATYNNLVTVASASEQVYSASLPSGLTGTVYIRVVDSDRAWGNTSLDNCYVDNMYIEYSSTPGPPVANFAGDPTAGIVPLSVSFTDLSTGNPTSWSWDFGDGGTATVQNPSHDYATAGTYTVSLTATNTYGSGTETKVNYITVTPAGQTVRVASVDVVNQGAGGPNRQAVATVTVVDGNGAAVSGAVVSGYFNAPNGTIKTGTTDGSGTATITSDKTKTPPADWCFTVTDVSLAGFAWNQGDTTGCESTTTLALGGSGAAKLLPSDYVLSQNYPNPFNPSTEIEFSLPDASHVNLAVYNVVGQQVIVLADGYMEAGVHHVTWQADGFATGMYFYRLTTDSFTQTRKMLLVK